jgi:hypothetical protein
MKHRFFSPLPVTAVLILTATACASSDESASAPRESAGAYYPGTGGGGGSSGADFGMPGAGGASAIVAPPEQQVEKAFEAPVATGKYVWSANAQTGQVARISAETYQVVTASAGSGPKYVAAVPARASAADGGAQSADQAIVLNEFSNDATLLTATTDTTITKRTYRVAAGANAWAVSPDGKWAIAWTDAKRVTNADSTQGFQTISVIDLRQVSTTVSSSGIDESSRLIVGYRPVSISFAKATSRAYAVTADGIDVIDLVAAGGPARIKTLKWDMACTQLAAPDAGAPVPEAGPPVPEAGPPVPEAGPPADAEVADGGDGSADAAPDAAVVVQAEAAPPVVAQPEAAAPAPSGTPDVTITPDGSYAIYRREGSADVVAIDLSTDGCSRLTLGAPITGLGVTAAGDKAVAVLRSLSQMVVMAVPTLAISAQKVIEGETVGSVVIAQDGKTVVLYTNALAISRMTVVSLGATTTYRAVELHAPVLAVYPTPDATYAVILHKSFGGTAFTKPGAIGVVPLAADLSGIIQATDAPPQYVAIAPDSKSAIVSVRDDAKNIYAIYRPRMPSLDIEKMTLASPPMSVGVVGGINPPAGFIAQEYAGGRITFIDLEQPEIVARTITGFELGARVVEWPSVGGN